ncbi:MAG TPA: Xaa-Pro peptidase family protein [Candidatus Acidoferrum sp.]|jgi:Xaa-Pro dipeptidase
MALNDSALTRRKFLNSTSALALTASVTPFSSISPDTPAFASLKPLGDRVHPITAEEFQARARHAQELMGQLDPQFGAIVLGPGTSLYYFTGIRWWLSERLLCLVLPRSGQPILISPAFEESRMRESLRYPVEVRVWQEDESPTQLIASAFADRKITTGRIGIEEALPFTFYDHLRATAFGCTFVSADPVTIGCRAIKSEHELALMRLACEATFDVFREVFGSLKEGMSQEDIGNLINTGFAKMEVRGEALVLLGASAAQPHGSKIPKKLKEGDVVLIDGGCTVQGYQSDVTRTGVFGKPSAKVQQVYEILRKTQDAALDAARAGKLSGSVDDAARAVITNFGYGPDYKYFTHRLGHGIGLDGHEHPYLVRGSKTVLMPGMTFSNEPGIYIPGEFGLRCEDDMVITADGPAKLLTAGFQVSLEKPLG